MNTQYLSTVKTAIAACRMWWNAWSESRWRVKNPDMRKDLLGRWTDAGGKILEIKYTVFGYLCITILSGKVVLRNRSGVWTKDSNGVPYLHVEVDFGMGHFFGPAYLLYIMVREAGGLHRLAQKDDPLSSIEILPEGEPGLYGDYCFDEPWAFPLLPFKKIPSSCV